MALDDKTGGTLSQDDIDKLMGGDSEGRRTLARPGQACRRLGPGPGIGSGDRGGEALRQGRRKAPFTELDETSQAAGPAKDLDFILDIPLEVTVEMGRTRMLINDLLQIGQGSVIELNRLAGEPLDILINSKLIARGEVVVVSEKFGIRITDIVSPLERVKRLA
jgi:flagellar motor switch protein FliN/FliY